MCLGVRRMGEGWVCARRGPGRGGRILLLVWNLGAWWDCFEFLFCRTKGKNGWSWNCWLKISFSKRVSQVPLLKMV